MNKPASRIVLGNVLLLLAAAVFLRFQHSGSDGINDGYMYSMAGIITLLLLANLLALLLADDYRKAFLLSMLLVLLIGFGTCVGGMMTF